MQTNPTPKPRKIPATIWLNIKPKPSPTNNPAGMKSPEDF